MITYFRHYDILVKTHSRMKTAITFFRQNDVGSRAHYLVLGKSPLFRLRLKNLKLSNYCLVYCLKNDFLSRKRYETCKL